MSESPILLTQEELEERGAYWQRRLRLQDWRITFRIVNREEMDHPNSSGRVNFTLRILVAEVLIIRPEDYPPFPVESWRPQDMEHDLVHELMHLRTAPMQLKRDSPQQIIEEQVCDLTAELLVALDREVRQAQQEAPIS